MRAGLPIPGRGPKLKVDVKKSLIHKRNNQFLFKRSTFFPHQDITFNTSDESKEQPVAEESVSTVHIIALYKLLDIRKNYFNTNIIFQEDDTLNGGSDDSPEIRQLNLLRQVKAEKAQDSPVYKHVGYKVRILLTYS